MLLVLGIMSTVVSCKDNDILKQTTKIEHETYYAKVGEEITIALSIENDAAELKGQKTDELDFTPSTANDSLALVAIYNATKGDYWTKGRNWTGYPSNAGKA